jgi:hypothetical protein
MTTLQTTRLATAFALLLGLAVPSMAADPAPSGHGIVTMTRGVKIFNDAETQLISALKARDTAAIDRLVGPDFEQRSQGAPGTPLPREEWLAQAPAEAARSTGLREMAVHDYGDLALVSFLWAREQPHAPAFVVDVWRRPSAGEPYQLVTRYLSAQSVAPTRKSPTAQAAASSPVDPKR